MASFKSALVTMISGSIGGMTFLRSRTYPLVARARVKPVDPHTLPQSMQKAEFNNASIHWKKMTQADRDAWDFFASGTPYTNRLGDTVFYKGKQLYIAIRGFIHWATPAIGYSAFDTARGTPGWLAQPTCVFGVASPTTQQITITNQADEAACLTMKASTAQNHSRIFWKGPWNPNIKLVIINIAAHAETIVTMTALCPDARYFIRLQSYSYNPCNLISRPNDKKFDTSAS